MFASASRPLMRLCLGVPPSSSLGAMVGSYFARTILALVFLGIMIAISLFNKFMLGL